MTGIDVAAADVSRADVSHADVAADGPSGGRPDRPARLASTGERLSGTARVEAFSDGVMAIAITLLVLNLKVPNVGTVQQGALLDWLAARWPSYVAYLGAFISIAVIWLNHRALVDAIAYFDRRLHWLNLTLLLGVATLPFPTALMAEFVAGGGPNAAVATALYGALALIMALPWTFIWRHLRDRPDLLEPGFDVEVADRALRRNMGGPLVYGAAAVIALVAPLVSLVLYVLIALFFASVRQAAPQPGAVAAASES